MLLNRIELFVTVAKHHNLAKTAHEMHVSTSSVCQRLKSLENDFGVKLYRKSKHGIELTKAGQSLLTAAGDVLNRLETLRKDFNPNLQVPAQFLTVAGSYTPSARYLPSAIAAFQKSQPEVKVSFLTSDRAEIERLVKDLQVDIAIIQSPSKSSDFYMEHFAADHLMFFAHPTHPLIKKKRLAVQDLSGVPLIVRDGRGATDKMLNQLKGKGITLNVTLRCISPDGVKAAVRRKMGVGILFYNLIEDDVKRADLKILKIAELPAIVGNSYIVYSKKKSLSATAAKFLAVLRARKMRQRAEASQNNKEE